MYLYACILFSWTVGLWQFWTNQQWIDELTAHAQFELVKKCYETKKTLESQPESNPIFSPHFLQLRHDAVRNQDVTLCQQAVHGGRKDLQFVLNWKVDKVSINQETIRGAKSLIELKKHRRWRSFSITFIDTKNIDIFDQALVLESCSKEAWLTRCAQFHPWMFASQQLSFQQQLSCPDLLSWTAGRLHEAQSPESKNKKKVLQALIIRI